MRFVVDQHKQVEHLPRFSTLPRHCESLKVGEEMMRRYTKRACQRSPELSQAFRSAVGQPPPPVKQVDPDKPQRKPRQSKPKAKKVEFPITRFTCIMANPVAQIWVCTKAKWEGMSIGRRSEGGRPPRADNLPHEVGEYAVLKGDEPVLDENGTVRVFALRMQAEAMMETLYDQVPADEKMSNNTDPERPTTTVYQNQSYSVHFDPDFNGPKQPFNIFDTQNFKIVLHPRGDFPLKYRTITSAITEADRLDKLLRGV
jgi:hypothetical protein